MDLIERATILHYHRHRINTHSNGTVGALGWRSDDSQSKRFEVIAQVGDLGGRSVLDVGCGYGDLKGYLDNRFSGFTYIGIDQMPEFIAEAEQRYAGCENVYLQRADFTVVNFPLVDYVVASGALGYRCNDPGFYTSMIAKMYLAASEAVVFNMLDAARFEGHPLLVGHDVDSIERFCKSLSPRVRVIRGYLEDDFTVFMYRPDH